VENLSATVKIEKDKKEKLDRFLVFSKSLASTPVLTGWSAGSTEHPQKHDFLSQNR
jgi:hypothetical protein